MNLTSKRMLQFMTVCAGACALSATATTTWVSDSFEAPEGTNTNPISWYKMTVSGGLGENTNFLWAAANGDASKLASSDALNTGFADTTRPIPAADKLLVLNLETEGQTLSRLVTNGVDTCSFDTDPVYVDTLIKFTPSEDTPTIVSGTKVAVYVNVDSNLVVYHQAFNGSLFVTNSVTSLFINPTNWYRLTIEMRNTVDLGNPACKIRLNGTLITHENAFMDDYATPGGSWFITGNAGTTLSQVAFQGTGAVDELVVTDIPADFGGSGIFLTLMFTSAEVEVRTNGVTVGEGTVVADGQEILITAKPWYEITSGGALFMGGATTNEVSGTTMITNIIGMVTGLNGQTNTVTSQPYSQSGSTPTGLGGSYPANLVAAWALDPTKGNGVTTLTSDMLDEYLLNTAIGANPGLEITNIVYNAGVPNTTIIVVATNAANVVDFTDINGTMKVQTATNLVTGFGAAADYPISVTNSAGMTIVVPGAAGNFLKAVVQ